MRNIFALLVILHVILGSAHSATLEPHAYWSSFRKSAPILTQNLTVSPISDDGRVVLVFPEPPARVFRGTDNIFRKVFGGHLLEQHVFLHPIGFDGHAKDAVLLLGNINEATVDVLIAALHEAVFNTDYKAFYTTFEAHSWEAHRHPKRRVGSPNLRIGAATIYNWLVETPLLLVDRTAARPYLEVQDVETNFDNLVNDGRTGVFHSKDPGIVLLLIDRNIPMNDRRAWLRQFVLDSDVLIGAISREDSDLLAILGRSRTTSVSDSEPLNIDTILTLAASKEHDLLQSYERNAAFAGKVTSNELLRFMEVEHLDESRQKNLKSVGVDWAPILLSRNLTNSEYGQLLNITDQMLKAWSMANVINYGNFPHAPPIVYPDATGVYVRIQKQLGTRLERLVFNWNTAGHGIVTPFGRYRVFSVHNTGALPVSYISDGTNADVAAAIENTLFDAEDEYGVFFANLRDPYITRVAQYAALHLIFQAFPVRATREEPLVSEPAYAGRWVHLRNAVLSSFQSMEEFGALENPTEPIGEEPLGHECGRWALHLPNGANKTLASPKATLLQRYKGKSNDKLLALADAITYPRLVRRQLEARAHRLDEQRKELNSFIIRHYSRLAACRRENDRGWDCSFLSEWGAELKRRDRRLVGQEDEWKESRRIYEDADSLRGSLRPFGSCSAAWRGVVSGNRKSRESTYLTPSIVVSFPDNWTSTGGHNLEGRSLRIIGDSKIPKGRIRVSNDGNALRLNPLDVENGSAAARILERARVRFAAADKTYRRRLLERAEATLASDTRSVQEFERAALKLPGSEGDAVPFAVPNSLNRDTAQSVRVPLTEAQAAEFRRVAEESGADLVVSQAAGVYRTVVPSRRSPFAAVTFSRGANQRDIQNMTALVARSKAATEDTVSIVSDGTFLRTDLEAVRLSGTNPTGRRPNRGRWSNSWPTAKFKETWIRLFW